MFGNFRQLNSVNTILSHKTAEMERVFKKIRLFFSEIFYGKDKVMMGATPIL